MQPDNKIVRMANQIATFFLSQPEEVRIAGVSNHINKFWEPRMRRQFFEIVDNGGGELLPLVVEAARQINRPEPAAQPVD
ncbi:MAG: formate dehydrogenase subunit delta [Rhizobiaceae bacterium]|nr:formate dehydrogenase subunit delta [Rhizobiaceae bacterium]